MAEATLHLQDHEFTAAEWIAQCRALGMTDRAKIAFTLYAFIANIITRGSSDLEGPVTAHGALLLAATDPTAAGWMLECMALDEPEIERNLRHYTKFISAVVRELRDESMRVQP